MRSAAGAMLMLHKGILVLAAAGAAAFGIVGRTGPAAPPPPLEFTGKVIGWSANRLGDVALELQGELADQNRPIDLWFVAGADRTETVRFEQVMIEIALRHAETGQPVTVVAEGSTEGRGRSLKDAIKLSSIRWEAR